MKIKKFDQFNEGLFDFMNRGKRGKDILDMIEELTPEDITKEDNSPIEISYRFGEDSIIEATKFLNENRYNLSDLLSIILLLGTYIISIRAKSGCPVTGQRLVNSSRS